jgi:hypothetical protein
VCEREKERYRDRERDRERERQQKETMIACIKAVGSTIEQVSCEL